MKVKLELLFESNDVAFLEFLDSDKGKDVFCVVIGGKLFNRQFDEHNNEMPLKEITILDFINLIKLANEEKAN
jgi:hypothetical protein